MTNFTFTSEEKIGLVTVIIPAFNRLDYINQTIDSVLSQTHQPLELIVVDDGSSDGTLEAIKEYGDKLLLLQHPNGENRGQAAAINLGLKQAKGEFIAILDSDDYWHNDYLSELLSILNANQDVSVCYCNGMAVDNSGNHLYPLFKKDQHIERNQRGDILLNCYISSPGTTVVRRSLYEKVGCLDQSLRSGQDHDMLIRFAEQGRFSFCDKHLFYYRQHADSISAKGAFVRWNNAFVILEKAISRESYPKHIIRARKAVINYRLGNAYKKKGMIFQAAWRYIKALLLSPKRALNVLLKRERSY